MSSSQDLDTFYNTSSPYTYSEWHKRNTSTPYDLSVKLYNSYLKEWYIVNNKLNLVKAEDLKNNYINLLKELTYFFNEEEKDLFLKDIDFNNDTELIYSIPFFVQKLKEVALTLCKRRDYIKNNRKKFDSIGSSKSLENILYEFILNSQTKSSNSTQIAISSLGSVFPELTAVKDNFIVEVEEIYDDSTYSGLTPLSADLLDIVPRIGQNPIFTAFASFLEEDINTLPLSSFTNYTNAPNIYSISDINSKYLGNTVYGLTATKAEELPTATVFYDVGPGNNWFYWPSGEVFTNIDNVQNTYEPILLQDSAFTLGESTGGSSYLDSDLFFAETKLGIEGAWLRGSISSQITGTLVMTSQPGVVRSFIFPVPGYDLSTTYIYLGRKLDDEHLYTYNLLDPALKADITEQYFNKPLETNNVTSILINKSALVYSGATAGATSLQGDVILKRPPGPYNSPEIPVGRFADESNLTESAFLYKLTSAELPIDQSTNYIDWPILSKQDSDYVQVAEITPDTCNDVNLGYINISNHMLGAVAGETIDTADVIYKLTRKGGTEIEAAWLQGGSVKDLAAYNSYSIPVYDRPAENCVEMPEGSIQSSLSIVCEADKKVSFVWCDIDTYADEVFKYINHAADCPYIQKTHDYLKNSSSADWQQCSCKSVHYSPIGHPGETYNDYTGGADCLFADPQGLGVNFTFTAWRDTRNFNYKNSPQFAFFKKDDISTDVNMGWGRGHWQTSSGDRMVLKTGRRYTYIRSSLKNTSSNLPDFVARYPYKKIISSVQSSITQDIILAIDVSGSEFYSIEKTKKLCQRIVNYINTSKGSQVGIVIFNSDTVVATYLTSDKQELLQAVNLISVQSIRNSTNINAGLQVAHKLLTTTLGVNVNKSSLAGICSNLDISVQTPFTQIRTTNIPNSNNKKTIILFSDGAETVDAGKALATATSLKKDTKIISVDIGPNSSFNKQMELFASTTRDYVNFEKALLESDSDNQLDNITSNIISNIYGNISMQPVWRKAIFINSLLTPTYDISDMVLRPGDHLKYEHQSSISYGTTSTTTSPFIISVPLYGWNYDTKDYDGVSLGAKPYWGKVYNEINTLNNFTKYSREMGGHIRYFRDYIPISHPEISDLLFSNNNYIEYRNNGCDVFVWRENINFTTTTTKKEWLKLKACIQPANLREIFNSLSFDKIFEQTEEPSTIALTTFNEYVPSYYCYYARNAFSISQNLILRNSTNTYVQIQTGIAIPAAAAHLNITNTHYASIISQVNTNNFVVKDQVGGYLLPSNLGVPYYLGRGFTNEIDTTKIQNYNGELLFLDPNIYTSNRGLTKDDQYSPYKTVNVDNTWVKESYNSEKKAGVIINSTTYQKFVPYQSNYETYKYNVYGLSRQDDKFEFWSGPNNEVWNDEEKYPTNYKKEIYNLDERVKSLLVTDKTLCVWQTDLDGNNYGIYKNIQ
jgi:hypothetical protein